MIIGVTWFTMATENQLIPVAMATVAPEIKLTFLYAAWISISNPLQYRLTSDSNWENFTGNNKRQSPIKDQTQMLRISG